jgi:hypothetical protein
MPNILIVNLEKTLTLKTPTLKHQNWHHTMTFKHELLQNTNYFKHLPFQNN